jgi:hypothetical protein
MNARDADKVVDDVQYMKGIEAWVVAWAGLSCMICWESRRRLSAEQALVSPPLLHRGRDDRNRSPPALPL